MAKKRANGEGNIRKRKDGRWEGRYTAGYDEKTGKRLIKNVLGKTQAEVKEKLAKAVAEAESVDVRRADEYTLGTWLQTWYELYAKPHLRFSTAEYYRRGIELHITPRIGDIPLKKLTGRDLQGLYKDLREHGRLREAQKGKQPGLSDSTIRGIHTMLHNALDRAVKERLIVRNPADDCVPPKIPKHEMKILPQEQIKSYLTAAEQRGVLPMFYLELISGLRKGELVALQWSDLDIENKTISVSKQAGRNNAGEPDITRPKTENSIRKISIPQDAVDLLVAEHQKHPGSPWMFPSPKTGEMYHPDSVVNIHKKILKDAGLEHLRFHDLRHPYVKHTTKNFVFPYALKSWILYVISMRLNKLPLIARRRNLVLAAALKRSCTVFVPISPLFDFQGTVKIVILRPSPNSHWERAKPITHPKIFLIFFSGAII